MDVEGCCQQRGLFPRQSYCWSKVKSFLFPSTFNQTRDVFLRVFLRLPLSIIASSLPPTPLGIHLLPRVGLGVIEQGAPAPPPQIALANMVNWRPWPCSGRLPSEAETCQPGMLVLSQQGLTPARLPSRACQAVPIFSLPNPLTKFFQKAVQVFFRGSFCRESRTGAYRWRECS